MNSSTTDHVTLYRLGGDLLRRRGFVAFVILLSALGSATVAYRRPPTYSAYASFVAEARSAEREVARSGRAMHLQRLTPVDPEYYVRLLVGRGVLVAAAATQYVIPTESGERRGTAADLYGLAPSTSPARVAYAAQRLRREVDVTFRETGTVVIRVRTFNPRYSQLVAKRLLELAEEHNQALTRARGESEMAFLTTAEQRSRIALRDAERRLARFLEGNRAFSPSSPIALQQQRLAADVSDKRLQHASLARASEIARIHWGRPAQTIFIAHRPGVPSRPDPRGVIRSFVIGGIGGSALAALIVLVSAHIARLRAAGSHDLSDLVAEWGAALGRGKVARAPATGESASALLSREGAS